MRNPRSADWIEALQLAAEGKLSEVWTALPAYVVSFDPTKRTCVVQPTIQLEREDEYGAMTWETFPILTDVLVQFPGGGGFVMTFPLAAGDEGIVLFSARCLDAWWERGGIQVQAERRMFDLSDGMFIPTVRSLPNVEVGISATDTELRAVAPDGPKIALKPNGAINVSSPIAVSFTAPEVHINGLLVVNGEAYIAHMHTGVMPGGSNTGGKV